MIPDFPHIIEVRLAALIAETANRAETLQSQDAKKKIMGPILFSYYVESLVLNLNSKPLWFHSVRPNIGNRKEKMATILVQKF